MDYNKLSRAELIALLVDDDEKTAVFAKSIRREPAPNTWQGWRKELDLLLAGCRPVLTMLALTFVVLALLRSLVSTRRLSPVLIGGLDKSSGS